MNSLFIRALGLVAASSVSCMALAGPVSGQGSWQSNLQNRDYNHDGIVDGFYDTRLNITWLADANYAKTSGFDTDGAMDWYTAQSFANGLSLFGASDWRLPTVDVPSNFITCSAVLWASLCGGQISTGSSEMADLNMWTLGNAGEVLIDYGFGYTEYQWVNTELSNTANFRNFQRGTYWSDTYYQDFNSVWTFDFPNNFQMHSGDPYNNAFYALLVHHGDIPVSAVPVPGALYLALSALSGLGFGARRRRVS